MKTVTMVIGGDLAPTQSNIPLFEQADMERLLGADLLQELTRAEFRLFNLESPLTDRTSPISKCGPAFSVPAKTVAGVKGLNPTLLTLANNHILDQGPEGLRDTISLLKQQKIDYVGAGDGLDRAQSPYVLERDGIKIGVYACAEHEFSIANKQSPGANPFDPLTSLDHIAALKEQCHRVVVLYHGGREYYPYPSPYLQKVCRRMVEKGADLVVCQHSHCIGCMEEYQRASIVYGQGNFLFGRRRREQWNSGLLVRVVWSAQGGKADFLPLISTGEGVRLAPSEQAMKIMDGFYQRSRQITQPGFVEEAYRREANAALDGYLKALRGNGTLLRALIKLLGPGIMRKLYSKKALLHLQNYVECEAHRELLLSALEQQR